MIIDLCARMSFRVLRVSRRASEIGMSDSTFAFLQDEEIFYFRTKFGFIDFR